MKVRSDLSDPGSSLMNICLLRWGAYGSIALVFASWVAPVAAQSPVSSGTIITIAGNGVPTFAGDGGQAIDASFNGPLGMAIGPDGTLYIADASNYRIRGIDPTSGIISTVAGNGPPPGGFLDDGPNGDGGPATDAQIGAVLYVDLDRQRNALYIPSPEIFRVRKVDLATGVIENFAGKGLFDNDIGFQDGDNGPATQAYLYNLFGPRRWRRQRRADHGWAESPTAQHR